jgi:4-amino-4-deoxy-L-arabinose transferase-like glycosyltransferase
VLLALPIGFHLLISLHWAGSPGGEAVGGGWRRALLLATVFSGAIVAVTAELLSLFGALTQAWLAVAWGALAMAAAWLQWRRGTGREGLRRLATGIRGLGSPERAIVVALLALAGLLLAVAWVSPPNTVDSLVYHMTKVVHWAQDHSLRHFAAINHSQLNRPPWAEISILHLRTLFGSDRPANLVQWFSMATSVVAVSGITGLLGGSLRTQLLAAAAAFSIPMGVLQSTSTQNDYAAALWAVILGYLVLLGKIRPLRGWEVAALAGSVGLGMLTKGTFFAYAAPLLVWQFLPLLLRARLKPLLLHGAAISAAALALNLGFWSRNIQTYGGPYGPSEALRLSLGRVQGLLPGFILSTSIAPTDVPTPTPAAEPSTSAGGEKMLALLTVGGGEVLLDSQRDQAASRAPASSAWESAGQYARLVVGMAGWNLITPSAPVNNLIMKAMASAPSIFNDSYLAILRTQAWNHEDTAGNPLHLLLFLLASVILAVTRFHGAGRLGAAYALSVTAAYILLPTVASAGAGNWGIRYQLPFFVLACPVIAWGLGALPWQRVQAPVAGVLLLSAVPYMVFNNTRPIVGRTPWPTRVPSVFAADPSRILLAMAPEAREAFLGVAEGVRQAGCDRVGLRLDSGDLEYALWWLLEAPQSGVRVETLYPLDTLTGLVDRSFVPCAVICSICDERRDTLNGLGLYADRGILKLYVGGGFTWE